MRGTDLFQVGEIAEFWWDRPAQLITSAESSEVQMCQVGEIAEFWWDRPAQLVIIERDSSVRLERLASSGGIDPLNWLLFER